MNEDELKRLQGELFDEVELVRGDDARPLQEGPGAPGLLARKLQAIVDHADAREAVRLVLEEIRRAGDSQEGLQPSPTLIMVKQALLALEEIP